MERADPAQGVTAKLMPQLRGRTGAEQLPEPAMKSDNYNHRLARVLEARAAVAQRQNNPLPGQIGAILVALIGAAGMFFILKGATLAYFGPEEFSALTAPLTAQDSVVASAGVHLWLGGIDPVSEVIARTLNPSL